MTTTTIKVIALSVALLVNMNGRFASAEFAQTSSLRSPVSECRVQIVSDESCVIQCDSDTIHCDRCGTSGAPVYSFTCSWQGPCSFGAAHCSSMIHCCKATHLACVKTLYAPFQGPDGWLCSEQEVIADS